MDYLDAVILGIVEGLTEFLPISSTGHLTIAEQFLGFDVDDAAVTAYTAVIQMGAIAAAVVYFARDIVRIAAAWGRGLVNAEWRGHRDHRMGWYVIVGSVPVGLAGFLFKDLITGGLRSLWVVGTALIAWSAVMWFAERVARQLRSEKQMTLRDAVLIGCIQVVSLVPGVSRSGATISGGLLLGLNRLAATRISFFLSIPVLTAAGLYELPDALDGSLPVGPMVVGTVVAFVVAYASIAWLLRFVADHSIAWFVPYRVALGAVILVLLSTGVLSPT
jgi:undecaprenyl-diphosphatase